MESLQYNQQNVDNQNNNPYNIQYLPPQINTTPHGPSLSTITTTNNVTQAISYGPPQTIPYGSASIPQYPTMSHVGTSIPTRSHPHHGAIYHGGSSIQTTPPTIISHGIVPPVTYHGATQNTQIAGPPPTINPAAAQISGYGVYPPFASSVTTPSGHIYGLPATYNTAPTALPYPFNTQQTAAQAIPRVIPTSTSSATSPSGQIPRAPPTNNTYHPPISRVNPTLPSIHNTSSSVQHAWYPTSGNHTLSASLPPTHTK